jgi:hypothetical protein
MEKISFETLQEEDLALRQRKEVDQIEQIADKKKEEFVKEVKEFIARCRESGGYIADEEERDFLRAILRFWGTFVYNASGTYPLVELNDLTTPAPKRHIRLSPVSLLAAGVLVLLIGAAVTLFVLRYPSIPVPVSASPTAAQLQPTVTPATAVSTTTPSASAVTLTAPQNGQTVPCEQIARGTYPPDLTDEIWPIVYVSGRYYPQDNEGQAAQKINGNWLQTVRFGDCSQPQKDVGKPFQLIVVTANESANAVFENYIKTGRVSGNWPGLIELPPGTNEQVRIVVIRQ